MANFMDNQNSTGKFDSPEPDAQVGLDDDQVEIVDLEAKQSAVQSFLLSRTRFHSLQKPTWTWIMTVSFLVSIVVLLLVVQPGWSLLFKANEADKLPPSDILQAIPTNDIVYLNLVDGTLQARKANDGSLQWSKKLDPEYNRRFLATTESMIYSASTRLDEGVIEAYRASDGRQLWKYETSTLASYALVAKGTMLYVHTIKGTVLALDGRNGDLLWQFFLGPYLSLDFNLHAEEGVVALNTNDDNVLVLRAEDGVEILNYRPGFKWKFAAENGMIYIDRPGLRFEAIRIKDGSLAWHYPPNLPDEHQIISTSYFTLFWQMKDGVIYINANVDVDANFDVLEALRAEDGKSLWQYDLRSSPLASSLRLLSLTYTIQDKFISISDDLGKFVILQVKDGSPLWHNNFRALEYKPQIAGDILFFGSDWHSVDVWLISKKRHLWGYTTSTTIHSYPTVDNGNMYLLSVSSAEGLKLDVIQLADGAILWRYPTLARKS